MSFIAISGSNSSTSINLQLLRHAASFIAADVTIVAVGELDVPMFGVDLERTAGIPAAIVTLHGQIQAADGVLLASPEHNGMVPAVLKNVIDWLSRVPSDKKWLSKPTVLLSTSPGGRGGRTVLDGLRAVVPHWGATLVGDFSLGGFHDHFDTTTTTLRDADKRAELQTIMAKLVAKSLIISAETRH